MRFVTQGTLFFLPSSSCQSPFTERSFVIEGTYHSDRHDVFIVAKKHEEEGGIGFSIVFTAESLRRWDRCLLPTVSHTLYLIIIALCLHAFPCTAVRTL